MQRGSPLEARLKPLCLKVCEKCGLEASPWMIGLVVMGMATRSSIEGLRGKTPKRLGEKNGLERLKPAWKAGGSAFKAEPRLARPRMGGLSRTIFSPSLRGWFPSNLMRMAG